MSETSDYAIYGGIPGRLVMLGFGSIGQACLPLLLRHIEINPDKITIIAADGGGAEVARHFNVGHRVQRLTAENCHEVVAPLLEGGGFLLNLSVDVSSKALVELARNCAALYLDTCTEPWAGSYLDSTRSLSERSNYALREEVLALQEDHTGGPTAVMTMGANPGLASVFVKTALLRMAADNGVAPRAPTRHVHWAELARDLGIKAIHIAERDTQVTGSHKKRGEFVNTWSVSGFISEGLQPAELGWGTHEKHWPEDAERHGYGCDAAIYLRRPGCSTRVRSWTPLEGPYVGFLITHAESISIADHLTVSDNGTVIYRPTVHYAYHPCDDAVLSLHELAGKRWKQQDSKHIVRDEITSGIDELGVLLMGNPKGAYWFGSRLSIDQARALAPYNNATSMQVVAGILGGMIWAISNPRRGIVEPDDIPYQQIMEVAAPYLGDVVGIYGDWDPLQERETLFKEDLDRDDPWQFKNIRVM